MTRNSVMGFALVAISYIICLMLMMGNSADNATVSAWDDWQMDGRILCQYSALIYFFCLYLL